MASPGLLTTPSKVVMTGQHHHLNSKKVAPNGNCYTQTIDRRLKVSRKKKLRIENIEATVEAKKKINPDQQKALSSKDVVFSIHDTLNEVLTTFHDLAKVEEKETRQRESQLVRETAKILLGLFCVGHSGDCEADPSLLNLKNKIFDPHGDVDVCLGQAEKLVQSSSEEFEESLSFGDLKSRLFPSPEEEKENGKENGKENKNEKEEEKEVEGESEEQARRRGRIRRNRRGKHDKGEGKAKEEAEESDPKNEESKEEEPKEESKEEPIEEPNEQASQEAPEENPQEDSKEVSEAQNGEKKYERHQGRSRGRGQSRPHNKYRGRNGRGRGREDGQGQDPRNAQVQAPSEANQDGQVYEAQHLPPRGRDGGRGRGRGRGNHRGRRGGRGRGPQQKMESADVNGAPPSSAPQNGSAPTPTPAPAPPPSNP